jgi:glycosyltransferase involved in cell wall biosynthesis
MGIHGKVRLNIIGIEDVGLNKLAVKYNISNNILFIGTLPYIDTLKALSAADLLLIIEAPTDEGIYLPAKFVDYVQSGRPILAISPKVGTLTDVISEYGGGLAADCRSASKIKEAINAMYALWLDNKLVDVYGSGRLYQLFSPATIIDKYAEIFQEIGIHGGQDGH